VAADCASWEAIAGGLADLADDLPVCILSLNESGEDNYVEVFLIGHGIRRRCWVFCIS
jgi:hypothetical protein